MFYYFSLHLKKVTAAVILGVIAEKHYGDLKACVKMQSATLKKTIIFHLNET